MEPTNRHNLNYGLQRKKFYSFTIPNSARYLKRIYADYLCWAAENLTNLAFSQQVQQVSFDETSGLFEVVTQRDRFFARHVCVGIGKQINLPDCVTVQDDTCFHASEMMLRTPNLAGKRVTVVGGGQSGADLFLNIFRGEWGQPLSLNWVSRRNNYNALDEAAFANEYFTPEYVDSFSTLGEEARRQMLHEQKMTSDGITTESLLAIYRAMYHRFEVLREKPWAHLLPSRSVTSLARQENGQRLSIQHHLDGGREQLDTDVVIFATGYRAVQPAFLAPLSHRLHLDTDEAFCINNDFTLEWDGPQSNRLFAVNAGMHRLGIAEPQLSLMAWRAARILNRAHPDEPFELATTPGVIHWRTTASQDSSPVFNALEKTTEY